MAAKVKVEDGYIVEYDEYDNRIRSYYSNLGNPTQIAVSGNRVIALIENHTQTPIIALYRDGNYTLNFAFSYSEVENIQMSGDNIIVKSTNGQTYEYDEYGNHIRTY